MGNGLNPCRQRRRGCGIGCGRNDNGGRGGDTLGCKGRLYSKGHEHVNLETNKLGCQIGKSAFDWLTAVVEFDLVFDQMIRPRIGREEEIAVIEKQRRDVGMQGAIGRIGQR